MRILGVDPGSNATGWGLVEREGRRVRHLRHGVLRPPRGADLAVRLDFLQSRLEEVLGTSEPEVAVIERVFLAANPRSALVLGHARGALLAGLGRAGVPVVEIAARQAKKAITGFGAADKIQMQTMVQRLLALEAAPAADAADALGLALSYAHVGAHPLTQREDAETPGANVALPGRRRNHRRALTRALGARPQGSGR
jgi:crossover junction endodeoxyribonuclease RuvC